jgi:hypothetical protein
MTSENQRNTELLDAELPDARFVDDAYLHWLYDENPLGPAIQRSADDDGPESTGRRIAHYAVIPQEYRDASGATPNVFSLNAVVRSGTQRKGLFTKLGLEIYEEAAARGRTFAIGVCNEKSIGAVVKYMGWRNVGPLPVRVCPPLGRGGDVTHVAVDAAGLDAPEVQRVLTELDDHPARGYTNRHTPAYLRWRLSRPHAQYILHVGSDLVAISTVDQRFGVRAAVILKLLPRGGRSGPISSRQMIAAVCRHHRAPYAVYAGWNAHVPVRGLQPPRRLQPSPLYLILRTLSAPLDQDDLVLDTFEFLDMDAY